MTSEYLLATDWRSYPVIVEVSIVFGSMSSIGSASHGPMVVL